MLRISKNEVIEYGHPCRVGMRRFDEQNPFFDPEKPLSIQDAKDLGLKIDRVLWVLDNFYLIKRFPKLKEFIDKLNFLLIKRVGSDAWVDGERDHEIAMIQERLHLYPLDTAHCLRLYAIHAGLKPDEVWDILLEVENVQDKL